MSLVTLFFIVEKDDRLIQRCLERETITRYENFFSFSRAVKFIFNTSRVK